MDESLEGLLAADLVVQAHGFPPVGPMNGAAGGPMTPAESKGILQPLPQFALHGELLAGSAP